MQQEPDEEQALLSEANDINRETARRTPKPKEWTWLRFVPGTPEFFERHLGTDMLIASWLLLVSTLLWVAVELEIIVTEDVSAGYINVAHWTIVGTGLLFTLGAFYFLLMSYPEELERMNSFLHDKTADELSCLERYFTGTDLLMATWFFYFAALPILVYGIWMIVLAPALYVGYMYCLGCLVFFAVSAVWVIGAMPENMMANNGTGTSHFYDRIAAPMYSCLCCCSSMSQETDDFLRSHLGNDVLFGMWMFTVMSYFGIPWGLFEIFYQNDAIGWLDFGMAVTFAGGMTLLTYTSYPGNNQSHVVWDFLSCKGGCCQSSRVTESSALQ